MNDKQKVLQYLDEAHAYERTLVSVLTSQIAMTPRGSYRTALETHLRETRDHAERVGRRRKALGGGNGPLGSVIGLAETVVGQVLAISKTPLDLLRGSGGEEKVLKNAKDACATEALEIATYTALERLARVLGDTETADLAASIRADEEKMLERVTRELPALTDAVVRADVKGEHSFDVTTTGAADAARATGRKAASTARKTTATAKRQSRQARKVPGVARAEGTVKGAALSPAGVPTRANDADPVPDEHRELRAAAAAGDGAAAFTLWERLRDIDFAAAEGWLRTAVELGDVRAAHRRGMLLWERRDVDAAEATLRRATADPEGAHALGRLLWQERSDAESAVHWLDRAAQTDDPAAERDLGIVLREHGDLQGAHYWLSRAADRDGEAREVLAALHTGQ
jgi:ferritin-like metal-binding protein YciE